MHASMHGYGMTEYPVIRFSFVCFVSRISKEVS